MEKLVLKSTTFLAVLIVLGLSACGPVEVEDISGLDQYAYVTGSFNQADTTTLNGTGTVRFTQTLPGVSSSRSLALKAQLDQTISSSSVSVVFNSSQIQLPTNNGVVVKFIRSGINVLAEVYVNGNKSTISYSRISDYIPASLDVIVEVHNESNRARVLIWSRDIKIYSAETADVDTERSGDISPQLPSNTGGLGIYSGLILENASVTAAQMDAAYIYW